MSVKAMSLVWDMECPSLINGLRFEAHHKYVLIAYADHADHQGRNIFPAVETIRKKTGYKSGRSIQNIGNDLEKMGVMIADGQGPRGTNRWRIPFSEKGDRIEPATPAEFAPPQNLRGANQNNSLGAIPSGAIPSGANIAPELKEPEPEQINNIHNNMSLIWEQTKEQIKGLVKRALYETWVEPTRAILFDGRTLCIAARNSIARAWLENNITAKAQTITGLYVSFIVSELEET